MKLSHRIRWLPIALLCAGLAPVSAGEAVVRETLSTLPALDCVIEPSEVVNIGSAVPGVIEALHFDRGDLVSAGQTVAQLESGVERAAVELARVRAAQETDIDLRRENAEFFQRNQSRSETLLRQAAISEQQMDELETEARLARLQIRQEKDKQTLARLEYKRAIEALDRRTIKSPIDGVITDRYRSAGEYVEDQPVLRVAQLHPLHVEALAPVGLLGLIVEGMQAQITPSVPNQPARTATVERVDRVADAASGTFGVRLKLANEDHSIVSGVRCEAVFSGVANNTPAAAPLQADTTSDATSMPIRDAQPRPEPSAESPLPAPVLATTRTMTASAPPTDASAGATKNKWSALPPPDNGRSETAVAVADAQPSPAPGAGLSPLARAAQVTPPGEEHQACLLVGPLRSQSTVQHIADYLDELGSYVETRSESSVSATQHFLLAMPSDDPWLLVSELNAAGQTDLQILTAKPYNGRVSMGLYDTLEIAQATQQRLARAGIETQIKPRTVLPQVWYLDAALPAERSATAIAEQLRAEHQNPPVNPVDCPPALAQHLLDMP